MNFHHLAYWQDKALSLAIENRLFINGEYTAAAENETFETVDPVTQAPLAKIARGKSVDIDRAVSAARGVFERGDWSLSSPAKRKAVLNKLADLMEANAEELALLETLDTGKPIRHSLRDDIPGAARAIRWYAEAIDKVYGEVATTSSHELAMIVREPVGVIAAIVPWNFPLLLTCWKLGPALAAGNSVVLKPSEKSPLSAIRLAGLAAAIGPTIFVDVDPNASLSREEIFGPVLVVTRFTSEEQALQLANDSQYGLGAAVWTRDLSRAHRMSRRLKAGSVFVNNYNDGDMTVPFGGYKQSGNGRDKSLHALEKFTELKTIWISLEA
ncbi:aldehyde dehydrogenase family protein [Escherichia coli]|nr:aldehyde dehydrogenase family protein [Escherichia coli]